MNYIIMPFLKYVRAIAVCSIATAAALTHTSSYSAEARKEPTVVKIATIESLEQIPISQHEQTLYLIDLDDTLLDFPYMVGSKTWRRYISEAQKIDTRKNWHDVFTYFLNRNYPVTTVEPITSQFVKSLQANGHIVCGLTARERNRWYDKELAGIDELTTNQLKSLDIIFDSEKLEKSYPYLTLESEYYGGTFFADIEPKGSYVLKLFEHASPLPKKVIFIDDKTSQVESVARALENLGIEYECYHYTRTDQKATMFDPLISNIQLYYFCKSDGQEILSDQEAARIGASEPEKDADYYLSAALELYLTRTLQGYFGNNHPSQGHSQRLQM